MIQVYVLLNDASGAAKAQQIVAADQPNQNTYGTLALYLYAGGTSRPAMQAAKKSVSLAPKSVRKQVKQQLDQTRAQASSSRSSRPRRRRRRSPRPPPAAPRSRARSAASPSGP